MKCHVMSPYPPEINKNLDKTPPQTNKEKQQPLTGLYLILNFSLPHTDAFEGHS